MSSVEKGAPRDGRGWYWALAAVLLVSFGLRVELARRGGQFYWPDEGRYMFAVDTVARTLAGHPWDALSNLFSGADHLLFKIATIPAAVVQRFGVGDWFPAAYLSVFTVGVLGMFGALARQALGTREAAFWAVFIGALTNALFYYSRHLYPYDQGMFFGLLALWQLGRSKTGRGDYLGGVWAGVGFASYNGYWMFCGLLLVLAVLMRWSKAGFKEAVRCAVLAASGLVSVVAGVIAGGAVFGHNLIASYASLSGTVTQGDRDEGWVFTWRFLQLTENTLCTFWVVGAAAALVLGLFRRWRALWWWVAGLIVMYCALAVMSDPLGKQVVMARTARQVIPFAVLATAGAVTALSRLPGVGRASQVILSVLLLSTAIANFETPWRQLFPPEFQREAKRFLNQRPLDDRSNARLLNAHFFHNALNLPGPPDGFEILFERPHPLQFKPYLLERYSRIQREEFEAHDITMRLARDLRENAYRIEGAEDPRLGGYPGPLRFKVVLKPRPDRLAEPLVVSGLSGKGDFITVRLTAGGQVVFMWDHWGYGGPSSVPLAIDLEKEHVIEVFTGNLMPPPGAAVYRTLPGAEALSRRLYVTLDGVEVFNAPATFYPSDGSDVTLATNFIGGTSATPNFSGRILRIERVPLEQAIAKLTGR